MAGPNRRLSRRRCDNIEEEGLEYERKRNERIRENQEKLESLGLPSYSSCYSLRREIKEAAYVEKEEEEYLPSDSDDDTGDDGNFRGKKSKSSSRPTPKQKKRKIKMDVKNEDQIAARKKPFPQIDAIELEDNDDGFNEEQALQKAISLSLGEEPPDCPNPPKTSPPNNGESGRKAKFAETVARRKKIKGNARRVQVSEDEAVAYFFSFNEAGKGGITMRDIKKMAIAHDFIWSEKEFADMIYFFNTNGDGKLNLSDFRSILSRCNMMQDSVNS